MDFKKFKEEVNAMDIKVMTQTAREKGVKLSGNMINKVRVTSTLIRSATALIHDTARLAEIISLNPKVRETIVTSYADTMAVAMVGIVDVLKVIANEAEINSAFESYEEHFKTHKQEFSESAKEARSWFPKKSKLSTDNFGDNLADNVHEFDPNKKQ